jgi:sodium-dependent dicarboxylate transporter 2/3/5
MLRGPTKPKEKSSFTALLQWKIVQSSFPWGLIIFIGGSTALAAGINKSGFSKLLASQLSDSMNGWNKESVLFVSMLLAFTLAFFITNTAAAYVMIEIMKEVSTKLKISPCYLTIPCVAVTSLAFILPAGTPTLALLQMRTHKMHAFRCLRLGVPLAFLLFFIVYIFAISIVDYMIPCKIY